MAKVQYTLRIEEKIFEKLKLISDKELRSINSQFEYFLIKSIAEYENENGAILLSEE